MPTVVSVAAEEPETAAKIVQPTMLVCSSPPGSRAIQGARPRNMSSESRVRKRISPIQMNSGRAVRVQLEDEVQIVVIMASPAGRLVNSSMPTSATPSSASATQTPVPSSRNRTNRNTPVSANPSSMARPYSTRAASTASSRKLVVPVNTRRIRLSHRAMATSTVPNTMASCGIHSGVASWPWLTSFSFHDQ